MKDPEIWPEPRLTDNARILLGYLVGSIRPSAHPAYGIAAIDAAGGSVVVENYDTENTYRISVVQIGGVE